MWLQRLGPGSCFNTIIPKTKEHKLKSVLEYFFYVALYWYLICGNIELEKLRKTIADHVPATSEPGVKCNKYDAEYLLLEVKLRVPEMLAQAKNTGTIEGRFWDSSIFLQI
jgi:hypothetical protein